MNLQSNSYQKRVNQRILTADRYQIEATMSGSRGNPTNLVIRNKDFSSILMNGLNRVSDASMFDCNLVTSNGSFLVHRLVLAAVSPFFERLITQAHAQHLTFFFESLDFKDLCRLVQYIYTGASEMPPEKAAGFYELLSRYELPHHDPIVRHHFSLWIIHKSNLSTSSSRTERMITLVKTLIWLYQTT